MDKLVYMCKNCGKIGVLVDKTECLFCRYKGENILLEGYWDALPTGRNRAEKARKLVEYQNSLRAPYKDQFDPRAAEQVAQSDENYIKDMERSEYESKHPKPVVVECPYCKSTQTSKISDLSKAASILMFGIFSQKRKYQWHCNKCNSDF